MDEEEAAKVRHFTRMSYIVHRTYCYRTKDCVGIGVIWRLMYFLYKLGIDV